MTSTQVAEVKDVLARPRLKQFVHVEEADAIVENISAYAHVLTTFEVENISPDPNDNQSLAAAIDGEVDLILLGERKHMLALEEVRGIPVVTTRETVKLMSHT